MELQGSQGNGIQNKHKAHHATHGPSQDLQRSPFIHLTINATPAGKFETKFDHQERGAAWFHG
jgi:hypothetical protein